MLLSVVGANAATLTVDTTADAGVGTLRQAMIDAVTNGAANDIVFNIPTSDPGYDGPTNRFTITLTTSLPAIPVSAITITNTQSQAVTVTGNDTFTIFTLVNSAAVVMTNITISHGFGVDGGGIYMGDSGTLTLNNCTISNNSSSFRGGGIYMSNSGTLHVHRSTFSSNTADYGGAIFPFVSGTVNMDTSTLSGNSATSDGGAIYVESASTLNATNNTFDGNSAGGNGGAIVNQATMTLTNNTITANSATTGGGIYNFTPAATLNSNIVALNTATNFGADVVGDGEDGIAYTGTYNLIGNADSSSGLCGVTNQCGSTAAPIDPVLAPLQNHGGPTFTRRLLNGSPAIDQGNSPGLIIDQRGSIRPVDILTIANAADGSDIGSYEFALSPTAAGVVVAGKVLTPDGSGGRGATVVLTGTDGVSRNAITSPFGYFQFDDVQAGRTYVISVTSKRYNYASQIINLNESVTDLELSPTPEKNVTKGMLRQSVSILK